MAVLSSPWQYLLSTPPATKGYTALLFTLSSFHLYRQFTQPADNGPLRTPYLTLIPGESGWFPWTLVTAGFVETSILELLFSMLFLPASLRYFERLWGTLETVKFVLVVVAIPNLISFFVNWLEYMIIGLPETFLYGQEYHGQMALQTAVLVAFTQLIPEHQIQLFGSVKLRVKRLPMIYVTFSTIMCLIGFQCPFILIQFGWLVAWTYLRFYKRTSSDTPGGIETYGDRSETFAFKIWFPPFLHYPIGILSDVVYGLALKVKLVRPFAGSAGDLEGGYSPVPGGARAEAERRRAIALKALDQRLASNAANQQLPASPEEVKRPTSKPSRPPPPSGASAAEQSPITMDVTTASTAAPGKSSPES